MQVKNKTVKFSWGLYDWANSAWGTVITTFIFATYFTEVVAENTEKGSVYWGNAIAISGLIIAILSPFVGSIADQTRNLKKWIIIFTLIYSFASILLWFTGYLISYEIFIILLIVVIGQVASEIAFAIYNAQLKTISNKSEYGKISGLSWGFGYIGGLTILIIILLFFVQSETPLFGLNKDTYEHIRICGPLVGLWILFFSLPLFFSYKEQEKNPIKFFTALKKGTREIIKTTKEIKRYFNLIKFLIARMFYIDGINTVFAFGGIYAAGTFGMPFNEVIMFGIGTNIAAGIGALAFSFIEDKIGSKKIIIFSLIVLTICGIGILLVNDKSTFWILGITLSSFFGPIQSASRVYFTKSVPDDKKAEFFGFYSLSGKITSFFGPLMFAILTSFYQSQRAGMTIVIFLLLTGLLMMFFVEDDKNSSNQNS
ncbi:MAG: hypothetical protein CFH21_00868 [Alphaproteobacteria bacterium MarineAlpha5_Bin11]|nr:MFS transporter [Pelagibacteraceae bacterium]PPR43220.1 MAG: hypothetical protein CFH21_00868 [Alphaproteobacteria bacterium MarineAlpha5_Bin11]PPR51435.1 MAG: hypothetical protein CFH20_00628 [Alphaproteobacteria bacterium MarineAlpha5_Bin10]|tara:strand:+ start:3896 stop:5176 length:1281 start_codon:yes stop_codon:yes gene_type:complete